LTNLKKTKKPYSRPKKVASIKRFIGLEQSSKAPSYKPSEASNLSNSLINLRVRNIKISADFKDYSSIAKPLFVSFEVVCSFASLFNLLLKHEVHLNLFLPLFLPFFLTEIKRHFGQVFSHVF